MERIAKSAWTATIVALSIILVRSLLIVSAHSPTCDEQYHLHRGLSVLQGGGQHAEYNDPPPGEALIAFPIWLLNMEPAQGDILQPLFMGSASTQVLQWIIAIWKSLLLWPLLFVVFVWTRELYGLTSGWLALGLVTMEPTLAAMTPLATPDTLGVTGVVIALYAGWRAAKQPTTGRLVVAGVAVATAMVWKHTGAITPIVVVILMTAYWATRSGENTIKSPRVGHSIRHRLCVVILAVAFGLWGWTGFDISPPENWGRHLNVNYTEDWSVKGDLINGSIMVRPMPAGMYLGSLAEAYSHGQEGHMTYFAGEVGPGRWWSYFPVVAGYKVPIAYMAIAALAIASLLWTTPVRAELWLALAAAAWIGFVVMSGINIGFRHALPGYVLLLMLSSRTATPPSRRSRAIIVGGAVTMLFIVGSVHVLSWHPNYLSYVNRHADDAYLTISDSNIDWGQSLKALAQWAQAQPKHDLPIAVAYFGDPSSDWVSAYLGEYGTPLSLTDPLPDQGLVAIGASLEVTIARYRHLSQMGPVAVLCGGAMRVYRIPQPVVPMTPMIVSTPE